MEQLLTYGLRSNENELKHISEVDNGLACNCVCSGCKHQLVAKNKPSNKKASHFAHHSGKECEGAIESALHLLAKEILSKTNKLRIPKYHHDYDPFNLKSAFKLSRELLFDNVILEKSVKINGTRIVPDAIGKIRDREIFIEFAKTHFIDEKKRSIILKGETACIEIDISKQILDETILTDFLSSETHLIYWIVNRKLDTEYAKHKLAQKLKREQKKIQAEEELRIETENLRVRVEKSKLENEAKILKYRQSFEFKVIKGKQGGGVSFAICPLTSQVLQNIQLSGYYIHVVIERILDGEFWNGEIYGGLSNPRHIFLGGQKVVIFPPEEAFTPEGNANKILYKQLRDIQRTLISRNVGNCWNCKFYVDDFHESGKTYHVCEYKTKAIK